MRRRRRTLLAEEQWPGQVGGCDHRCSLVRYTELGCHGYFPRCGTIGPVHPGSEAARRALLILGASEGGRRYR
jgi:hypothetical protein